MSNSFHFKSFLNFLKRNKLYTAINIFGFAVSLMFVILLGLYIQQERSVDAFHENKDRIYRLEHREGANYAPVVADVIRNRYPEIESTTRVFSFTFNVDIEVPRKEHFVEEGLLVDSTFLTMFSFPFVEGEPRTAMATKMDVVLTQSFAHKIFGSEPALGKPIRIQEKNYTVGGVVADFKNTHFRNPTILMPFVNLGDFWMPEILTSYANNSFSIYLLTRPNADLGAKLGELEEYFKGELNYWLFSADYTSDVSLAPLQAIYFTKHEHNRYAQKNDATFLVVLAVTALIILVFAVINYINLSVAQTGFRAQEAAIRRLLGGTKKQLFSGFIIESILLCTVSLLLAIGLAFLFKPFFNQMMNTQLSLVEGFTWENVGVLLGGILALGTLAGIVPALAIIGFKPIDVVKGTFRRKTKMLYSKVLIAFQYCITIALIGCTVTIIWQVKYMQTAEMGFDVDYIVGMDNIVSPEQKAGFRDQLLAIPGVEKVGYSMGYPPVMGNNNSFTDKDGVNHSFTVYQGDSVWMSIMNFEILSQTGLKDAAGVWINETGYRRLGLADDAIQYNNTEHLDLKILGKIKDFHIGDFSQEIGESMIRPLPEGNWPWNILIQVSPADPFGTLERIREVYNEKAGGNIFAGRFLDDRITEMYEKQTRMSQILGSLSILAVIISALGMLAMSTYFMRQRSQEVAVRKVFGAMNGQVLSMLMLSFLKLVVIAFVIAVPVIWYLMKDWLNGYPYRIDLGWQIFILAGLIAFIIASVTVLWQSLKAAHTNPIVSIRD